MNLGIGIGHEIWEFFTIFGGGLAVAIPPVVLGCAASKLYDTLGIKSQLRTVGIIFYFGLSVYAINIAFVPFGKWRILITYAFITILTVIAGIRMVYVKQLKIYLNSRQRRKNSGMEEELQSVFRDPRLFGLFANYTVTEYAVETLLFLLEYNQLKQMIIFNVKYILHGAAQQQQMIDIINDFENKSFKIASDIIKVNKLECKLTKMDCMKSIQYLYDQYIDVNALFPVNISYTVRNKIVKNFMKHNLRVDDTDNHAPLVEVSSVSKGDITNSPGSDIAVLDNTSLMITDILEAFEDTSTELCLLLYRDSYHRFRQTEDYKQFLENK